MPPPVAHGVEEVQATVPEPLAGQVGGHRLPGRPEPAVRAEEGGISVDVGGKIGCLDPRVRGPGQPVLLLQQPEEVGGVAEVIGAVVGPPGLPLGPLHGEPDGPREQFEPVPGAAAEAEVEVRLLAGDDQQLIIGEAAALGEHRVELGQANRAGVERVAVAVELGDVDGVDPQPLEDAHERVDGGRVDPGGPLPGCLDREGHVVVARKRFVAGEGGEAVAVSELEGLGQGLRGAARGAGGRRPPGAGRSRAGR